MELARADVDCRLLAVRSGDVRRLATVRCRHVHVIHYAHVHHLAGSLHRHQRPAWQSGRSRSFAHHILGEDRGRLDRVDRHRKSPDRLGS